jgi:hypothetical protein
MFVKKVMNLMYEKGPRQTAAPPPIAYGGEAPQQRNVPISSMDFGGGFGKKGLNYL